jgi:hypothetical protein
LEVLSVIVTLVESNELYDEFSTNLMIVESSVQIKCKINISEANLASKFEKCMVLFFLLYYTSYSIDVYKYFLEILC